MFTLSDKDSIKYLSIKTKVIEEPFKTMERRGIDGLVY